MGMEKDDRSYCHSHDGPVGSSVPTSAGSKKWQTDLRFAHGDLNQGEKGLSVMSALFVNEPLLKTSL